MSPDPAIPVSINPSGRAYPRPFNVPAFRGARENPIAGRDNPVTPDVILGRYSGATRLNPNTLPRRQWRVVSIDRPTIIIPKQPLTYVGTSGTVVHEGLIFYAPAAIPNTAAVVPLTTETLQKSTRTGVVYLPTPGEWWLYYDRTSGAGLDVVMIDAQDPAVASRYLSESGLHGIRTFTIQSTDAAVLFLSANRDRMACTFATAGVSPTTPTGNVRIGFTSALTGITGFRVNTSTQATVTFIGESLWKGDFYIIAETAGTQGTISVVEYF